MTVAELIEELESMPPEAPVFSYGGDEEWHELEGVELRPDGGVYL